MFGSNPPPRREEQDEEGARERPGTLIELKLVNLIRERVKAWRKEALAGGGGVTRTTCELMNYWRRDGRQHRLFFAQLRAAGRAERRSTGERLRGVRPLRLQDGYGQRQDDGHGDARRVEHPEQGERPRRRSFQ